MTWSKTHFLALFVATIVGFIYLAPNIFFIASLGDDYQGIPMMKTPNEDFYLGRIQEILDGHPRVSSFVFFEYKDQLSLTPPIGEFFYAVPSFLLNVSPITILIASRFYLPFILFLLVYFLIYNLTTPTGGLAHKANAMAGALLVTLGYDLVDYRSLWSLAKGAIEPGGFLLWARPVRPILGVIFLMSFLLVLWPLVRKIRPQKVYILGASLLLAVMVPSSFFDWGTAVSITAALTVLYLFKKEYGIVRNLIIVLLLAFLWSSPYWYSVWQSSHHEWYEASALRTGLFYTHYPLMNKFMLAVLLVYTLLTAFAFFKNKKSGVSPPPGSPIQRIGGYFQDWHLFCLALILGSLWVYSQQIITGMTVWPYHFVQYTIPFGMIVSSVLLYTIIKKESTYVWGLGVFVMISASLLLGIYTQAGAYHRFYSRYADLQSYASLYHWLNQQEKDCVILLGNIPAEVSNLDTLITAFTHCNIYNSNIVESFMPDERALHSYFVHLLFRGVTAENVEQYVQENEDETRGYLFSNWKSLYGVTDFPDFKDTKLEKRISDLPQNYREFLSKDIRAELNRYRLDYILSDGPLNPRVIRIFPDLRKVFEKDAIVIYSVQ